MAKKRDAWKKWGRERRGRSVEKKDEEVDADVSRKSGVKKGVFQLIGDEEIGEIIFRRGGSIRTLQMTGKKWGLLLQLPNKDAGTGGDGGDGGNGDSADNGDCRDGCDAVGCANDRLF